MAATVNNVTRTADASGEEIAAYEAADGSRVQGVSINPEVAGKVLSRLATNATALSQQVVKAAAGQLFQADVLLTTPFPTDRWLMVFDATGTVANGALPVWRARVGGGYASIDFGVLGLDCATGIILAVSTTLNSLTLPGAAEGYFQAGYL